MRHISEILDIVVQNMADRQFTVFPPTPPKYSNSTRFWPRVQQMFQDEHWAQISMLKMTVSQEVATVLSLRHRQSVVVYGKTVEVCVNCENDESVYFTPIE